MIVAASSHAQRTQRKLSNVWHTSPSIVEAGAGASIGAAIAENSFCSMGMDISMTSLVEFILCLWAYMFIVMLVRVCVCILEASFQNIHNYSKILGHCAIGDFGCRVFALLRWPRVCELTDSAFRQPLLFQLLPDSRLGKALLVEL